MKFSLQIKLSLSQEEGGGFHVKNKAPKYKFLWGIPKGDNIFLGWNVLGIYKNSQVEEAFGEE